VVNHKKCILFVYVVKISENVIIYIVKLCSMMQYPDLSGFSEEERMQLMTVMKKAQVNFMTMCVYFNL